MFYLLSLKIKPDTDIPAIVVGEHNPQIQSNRCLFNDDIVLTRFVIPVMFVFAPLT